MCATSDVSAQCNRFQRFHNTSCLHPDLDGDRGVMSGGTFTRRPLALEETGVISRAAQQFRDARRQVVESSQPRPPDHTRMAGDSF